jgi:predicted acylesterase/phospholipase RssA
MDNTNIDKLLRLPPLSGHFVPTKEFSHSPTTSSPARSISGVESLSNEPNVTHSANDLKDSKDLRPLPIKHLVIAGGGVCGFSIYGALRESHKDGFWNINNIESIYSTSVGAMFATILSLKYEWSIIDDYLIKRPWHQLFKFNMYSIINSFQNMGIFNVKIMEEIFSPLFKGKDIPITVTMKELYEITGIELHFYSTTLDTFEMVDFSYKTHPDWAVTDALYCSSCLPIIFAPFSKDGTWYFDGGTYWNYPIHQCIKNVTEENVDEIFGFDRQIVLQGPGPAPAPEPEPVANENETASRGAVDSSVMHKESTLFDYLFVIMNKTIERAFETAIPSIIKHEIKIHSNKMSLYDMYSAASSPDERSRLIEVGMKNWTDYKQMKNIL